MIDFFQKLEFFEIEIQKLKDPLYNLYVYSKATNELVSEVDFPDSPNFDKELIGGLTATFSAFADQKENLNLINPINSIHFPLLKIIYTERNNLIFIVCGDPYFEDSAFHNSINVLQTTFFSNFDEEESETKLYDTKEIQLTIEMMFRFIFDQLKIEIKYENEEYEKNIRQEAYDAFKTKLIDIFKTHNKFFKHVVEPKS